MYTPELLCLTCIESDSIKKVWAKIHIDQWYSQCVRWLPFSVCWTLAGTTSAQGRSKILCNWEGMHVFFQAMLTTTLFIWHVLLNPNDHTISPETKITRSKWWCGHFWTSTVSRKNVRLLNVHKRTVYKCGCRTITCPQNNWLSTRGLRSMRTGDSRIMESPTIHVNTTTQRPCSLFVIFRFPLFLFSVFVVLWDWENMSSNGWPPVLHKLLQEPRFHFIENDVRVFWLVCRDECGEQRPICGSQL